MPTPLQPERNPNRGYRQWLINEIWTGPNGPGSFVPNVDDSVRSWTNGLFRVKSVDAQGYSVLEPANEVTNGGYTGEDFTRSAGPVQTSDAYRIFINPSVVPYQMAIDGRLFCVHPAASHYKVFRGTDISASGTVISAVYNGAGVILSENVPLDEIGSLGTDDYRKVYRQAHCIEAPITGETATVVVYSADGAVLSRFGLYVERTDFVRTIDLNRKMISAVELVSDFISPVDNEVVDFPVNMTLQSGMFRGRVHYNDGTSTAPLPIDGTRFSLHGLNAFLPTSPGQVSRAVLVYKLASNEYANALTPEANDRQIDRTYRLKSVEAQGVYSVKLYVTLVWDNTGTPGYRPRFYMYSMARDVVYDVTSKVSYVFGAPAFVGNLYNVPQQIQVTVNLKDVISTLPYYVHTQIFNVTLKAPATSSIESSYASVSYDVDHVYGNGMMARYNGTDLFIDNGYQDLSEWINALYVSLAPQRYLYVEPEPVAPTHVRLRVGTEFYRVVAIEDVLDPIDTVVLSNAQGKTLVVEWLRREGSQDKELAMGFLVIKNI